MIIFFEVKPATDKYKSVDLLCVEFSGKPILGNQ